MRGTKKRVPDTFVSSDKRRCVRRVLVRQARQAAGVVIGVVAIDDRRSASCSVEPLDLRKLAARVIRELRALGQDRVMPALRGVLHAPQIVVLPGVDQPVRRGEVRRARVVAEAD